MKRKMIFGLARYLLAMLLIMPCSVRSFSQSSAVKGVVTDAGTGTSISGVTVRIKNTAVGVSTNADGNYTINATKGQILVFSSAKSSPLEGI